MQQDEFFCAPNPDERLLRTPEAARYLGLAPATLNKYRSVGGGPPFIKYARVVVYRVADLTAWSTSHRVRRSTADDGRSEVRS